MVKGTNAGGRTKEANEISNVHVHQHGGHDVTCKKWQKVGRITSEIMGVKKLIVCLMSMFVRVSACDGGDLFSNEVHLVTDRKEYPSCCPELFSG